jgi:hypothetical protein
VFATVAPLTLILPTVTVVLTVELPTNNVDGVKLETAIELETCINDELTIALTVELDLSNRLVLVCIELTVLLPITTEEESNVTLEPIVNAVVLAVIPPAPVVILELPITTEPRVRSYGVKEAAPVLFVI